MANTTPLTNEEVTLLVDKCTDGALTAADADKLASAIRRGNTESEWILNELEMAGLISEALNKTSVEDFIRGFCERLSADRSTDQFTSDTERRLAIKAELPNLPTRKPGLADILFAGSDHGSERTHRRHFSLPPAVYVMAILSLFIAAGIAIHFIVGQERTATITSASADVVLVRDDTQLRAEPGLRLENGDKLRVLATGYAVVAYDKTTVVRMSGYTDLIIVPPHSINKDADRPKSVHIERGSVVIDTGTDKHGYGIIATTPHARMEARQSSFIVSVTLSSTRLTVKSGRVTLTRTDGGKMMELTQGNSIVVGGAE